MIRDRHSLPALTPWPPDVRRIACATWARQFFAFERLGQKTEHAALSGSDGIGNGPMGRKNDHRQRRVGCMDALEQLHAIHTRHAQIRHHHLGSLDRQLPSACSALSAVWTA